MKFVSLLLLGRWTLDGVLVTFCGQGLLWPADLLWSLGSTQSFCGLSLKIVVRAPDSALKESDSGR